MINDLLLRDLAASQHGLVSTDQARHLGYTYNQLSRLADGVRWERRSPRVLRLVGTAQTDGQVAMLGVLDAGPGGVLSSTSAAAWWDIPGNHLLPIQVSRMRDATSRPNREGLNHEPTLLPQHHVVTLEGVLTVVPARALFDIAGMRRRGAEKPWWVDRMARMVDNAWSKRLVSGRSMHAMLEEMAERGRPGIQVMRLVLETRGHDYVPPASGVESRFDQILVNAGQKPMRRQVDIGDGDRWIGRVDFVDEDRPLIVEVQSERFHSSLIDKQLDAQRIARLGAAGFVVVEITDVDVWHRPHEVLSAVAEGRRAAAALKAA